MKNNQLQKTDYGGQIERALAVIGRAEGLRKHGTGPVTYRVAPGTPSRAGGVVVDLPRFCAVHDQPYAARYIAGDDGRFRRGPMIKVTEAVYLGQYADNPTARVVPAGDIAEETCPWCGASGFGSVRCGTCNCEICYGKTTGRFFRCRDSCGEQSNMTFNFRAHEGVTPCLTRRSGYSVS